MTQVSKIKTRTNGILLISSVISPVTASRLKNVKMFVPENETEALRRNIPSGGVFSARHQCVETERGGFLT